MVTGIMTAGTGTRRYNNITLYTYNNVVVTMTLRVSEVSELKRYDWCEHGNMTGVIVYSYNKILTINIIVCTVRLDRR